MLRMVHFASVSIGVSPTQESKQVHISDHSATDPWSPGQKTCDMGGRRSVEVYGMLTVRTPGKTSTPNHTRSWDYIIGKHFPRLYRFSHPLKTSTDSSPQRKEARQRRC